MLALAQVNVFSAVIAATKSTTSTKTSGGGAEFFIVLVLLAGFYFLYVRPRRAKMLAARQPGGAAARAEIEAGDTVVTTSGIIGRVLSVDGDRASVEIAPDTVVEFHRSTLGRRLDPDPPDEGDRWASLTTDNGGGQPAQNESEPETGAAHDDAGDDTPGAPDADSSDDEPGGVE